MPRNPGPIAKINLGGRPRPIAFGFNEFASIEEALGPGWMDQVASPNSVKAVLAVLSAGLSRFDEKATAKQVGYWLDELSVDEVKTTVEQTMVAVHKSLTGKDPERPKNGAEDDNDAAPLAPAAASDSQAAAGIGTGS